MVFRALLHLDSNCCMFAFQSSFESNTKPRSFTVTGFWILMLPSQSSNGDGIDSLVKCNIDVLLAENLNPFFRTKFSTVFMLFWSYLSTAVQFGWRWDVWRSSIWSDIWNLLSFGKWATTLLIFSVKNLGLTTLPWGMPSVEPLHQIKFRLPWL